jgi:hypothetical protein
MVGKPKTCISRYLGGLGGVVCCGLVVRVGIWFLFG